MQESRTQVLVLGGGPGGYAAAFAAADHGLSVTLVDGAENPGGVCLYEGCIPSKALLHAAGVLREAEDAARIGISFAAPTVDIDRLRTWKRGVVDRLTRGLGTLTRQRKITYVQGRGAFLDSGSVKVEMQGGTEQRIYFEQAIVATGSQAFFPPNFPRKSERIMDAGGALELPDVPTRLLVVGGGYIGTEMATIYSALGSKVTLVELTPTLLPGMDPDLVKVLAPRLQKSVEGILLETRVASMEETKNAVRVRLERAGQTTEAEFDRVLVSVGRVPNTGSIGLDKAGVTLTERGFVKVDEERRTSNRAIFAIGDVTGAPMLAHKASREGKVAANVIAGRTDRYMPLAVPAVVYTDPELAWAGLTEAEAKAQGRSVKVSTFPWSASGRAMTIDRPEGVTKLVVDERTGEVLGMGIAGHGAGDLIAEGVLAVEMQATAGDIGLMIHPHPTFAETILEAAEAAEGHATHFLGRR
ncbi:MAG: dihydrolipoyl dehydrogenase [Thermaerobacter sp.]|nr:dihydrolipoyl dehydrogenase [Thermaerobacter sp.]